MSRARAAKEATPHPAGALIDSELGRMTRKEEARSGPLWYLRVSVSPRYWETHLSSYEMLGLHSRQKLGFSSAFLPSWVHTYHKTRPNHSLAEKSPAHSLGKTPYERHVLWVPCKKIFSATSRKEAPQRGGDSLLVSMKRVGLQWSWNVLVRRKSTTVDICRPIYWGNGCTPVSTGEHEGAASDPSLLSE